MNKLIYLASPYSHVDLSIRQSRYEQVIEYATLALNQKHSVFSPIIHCHPIALGHSLPGDFKFWEDYLKCFIRKSDELWIAPIDGWKESIGVNAEINLARQLNIPIFKMVLREGKKWFWLEENYD